MLVVKSSGGQRRWNSVDFVVAMIVESRIEELSLGLFQGHHVLPGLLVEQAKSATSVVLMAKAASEGLVSRYSTAHPRRLICVSEWAWAREVARRRTCCQCHRRVGAVLKKESLSVQLLSVPS